MIIYDNWAKLWKKNFRPLSESETATPVRRIAWIYFGLGVTGHSPNLRIELY